MRYSRSALWPAAWRALAVVVALGMALPAQATEDAGLLRDYPAAMPAFATGFDALRGLNDLDLRQTLAAYHAAGARMLRSDLNWHLVQEAGPDTFDWQASDRLVHAAKAEGLALLFVVGSVPHWARKIPGEHSALADPADYARFLSAAVTRYAPQGIRYWEIWNEPNLDGPWPEPDAKAYAALLKAAYPAIKAQDPNAVVISGGLAAAVETGPLFGPTTHIAAVDFIKTLYAEGAGQSFDALGFHPYGYPRRPSDPKATTGWNLMTGPIRKLMEENGDGGKRIWITEFGQPTGGGRRAVTEEEQAVILSEAYAMAADLDYAGPLFWYSYQDLGDDEEDLEDWFGLIDAAGRAKPALKAFQLLPSGG